MGARCTCYAKQHESDVVGEHPQGKAWRRLTRKLPTWIAGPIVHCAPGWPSSRRVPAAPTAARAHVCPTLTDSGCVCSIAVRRAGPRLSAAPSGQYCTTSCEWAFVSAPASDPAREGAARTSKAGALVGEGEPTWPSADRRRRTSTVARMGAASPRRAPIGARARSPLDGKPAVPHDGGVVTLDQSCLSTAHLTCANQRLR